MEILGLVIRFVLLYASIFMAIFFVADAVLHAGTDEGVRSVATAALFVCLVIAILEP